MSDNEDYTEYEMSKPNPKLKTLDILVGTWKVSGPDVIGKATYEWMEGNFFLKQYVDLKQYGQNIKGLEIIGYERSFDTGKESEHIKSRFYDNMGNTLDYTYEIEGDILTIWGGEKGSPAYYKGTFNSEGNVNTGAWVYPDGGGYKSTMTKIK